MWVPPSAWVARRIELRRTLCVCACVYACGTACTCSLFVSCVARVACAARDNVRCVYCACCMFCVCPLYASKGRRGRTGAPALNSVPVGSQSPALFAGMTARMGTNAHRGEASYCVQVSAGKGWTGHLRGAYHNNEENRLKEKKFDEKFDSELVTANHVDGSTISFLASSLDSAPDVMHWG